jgi:aspartate-semialdehyde dehydrogenase
VSGDSLRVAVVGATGAVGTVMLAKLRERGFPAREIVPFASARSAGRELDGVGVVQPLAPETIQGFDLAIFSAGATTSGEWAPRFVEAGAVVVDNSSRWRRDPEVPLVVAEVNPEALDDHRGLISNPNCSTMQLMVALKPLYDAAGVERLIVSTYQSVSGTGVQAVNELEAQTRAALEARPLPAPAVYPHPIAFNVLGAAGNFAPGDDHTDEERKMMFETRKILGDESIAISVTCARVPVTFSHSESVNVQTLEPLEPDAARELLRGAPGIAVVDDPAEHAYPTARSAAGRDEVFVGRIRRDPSHPRGLCLWIVSDNLLKGAATNAVQVAETLQARGLIRGHARVV